MNYRFLERVRAAIESRNIPKWILGLGVIIILSFVVLGILISASQNSASSADMPGKNIVTTTGLFFNITLKLGIVLLLIYVSMQFLKRWQSGKQIKQKKILSVVETSYLNPRQALHLVKVGDKLLLIGSTDQSVTCLSEMAPDILLQDSFVTPENPLPAGPNAVSNFASILTQSFTKH